MANDLKIEAKTRASNIRNDLGFGQEPISDIFNLVEALDILLTKKPMPHSKTSAFFLNYKNNFLFFINSAQTLGKQYFSTAHELYHYFYDRNINGSVCNTFKFKNQNQRREKLADYFAVHFLMPESGVLNFMDRLDGEGVNVKKVIKA